MSEESDYLKYRGKCKEMSEDLCAQDPTLTLVRGHYYCHVFGEQPHWWCTKPDGTIVDPTAKQFPSNGSGAYVEFDGYVSCSECDKEGKEADFSYESNYAFCSNRCHMYFVGLGEFCK